MLPVVLQYQIPFTKGAASHDLDGIRAAGICLDDGHQLLVRCPARTQTRHQRLGRFKTDSQTRTNMAVEFSASLECFTG